MSTVALKNHEELCDDVYAFMLEENKLLKAGEVDLGEKMLEKKQILSEKLEKSVLALRDMNQQGVQEGLSAKDLLASAKKKMMKIFLLEKENAQLLTKSNYRTEGEAASIPVIKKRVQEVYGMS